MLAFTDYKVVVVVKNQGKAAPAAGVDMRFRFEPKLQTISPANFGSKLGGQTVTLEGPAMGAADSNFDIVCRAENQAQRWSSSAAKERTDVPSQPRKEEG